MRFLIQDDCDAMSRVAADLIVDALQSSSTPVLVAASGATQRARIVCWVNASRMHRICSSNSAWSSLTNGVGWR